ncbi:MAG: hypothetical protein HYZ45_09780 [Burkholderiales bacterium]|nr:hypothetical protein [Burkholderiales bacterium]
MKNIEFAPHLVLQTGADCRLSGIRIVQRGDNLQVVYAERPGMWAESKIYTFTIYELIKTVNGDVPYPDLYFKQVKKLNTKASYCDANNALDKESQLFL